MTREVVADASIVINLHATKKERMLLEALDLRLVMDKRVSDEVLFTLGPDLGDGEHECLPIDLHLLETAGLLRTQQLPREATRLFVAAAARLTDRDAQCVALAGHLGLALGTDDRKMKRVATSLLPDLEIVSTLALVKEACTALSIQRGELGALLSAMRAGARFDPPSGDPLSDWYREALHSCRSSTDID